MKGLDGRLSAVADMVRDGARVADIGTDHALLPVWLVKTGRCPCAVASDIGEGPAASARRTVAEAALETHIAVRVGDGLSPLSPDEVDDIVIAGMGGETIAAILQAAPWVAHPRYRLVLQPMSKPERLRRFLLENGFAIQRETVVVDGERIYTAMVVVFTGVVKTPDLATCVMGQVPHTSEGKHYLQKQGDRLSERLCGLPNTPETQEERKALKQAIEQISLWLKEE